MRHLTDTFDVHRLISRRLSEIADALEDEAGRAVQPVADTLVVIVRVLRTMK